MFEQYSFQRRKSPKISASAGKDENEADDSSSKLSFDSGVSIVLETPARSPDECSDNGSENQQPSDEGNCSDSSMGIESDPENKYELKSDVIVTGTKARFRRKRTKYVKRSNTDLLRNEQSTGRSSRDDPDRGALNDEGCKDRVVDRLANMFPTQSRDCLNDVAENMDLCLADAAVQAVLEMQGQDDDSPLIQKKISKRRKRIKSINDSDSDVCATPKKKPKYNKTADSQDLTNKASSSQSQDFLCSEDLTNKASSSQCTEKESSDVETLKNIFRGTSEKKLLQVYRESGSLSNAVLAQLSDSGEEEEEAAIPKGPRSENQIEISDGDSCEIVEAYSTSILEADDDNDEFLAEEKAAILSFFQTCSVGELGSVPECSKKKATKILGLKPFKSWNDLISKFDNTKGVTTQLIWNCDVLLKERRLVDKLMQKCNKISLKIQEKLLERVENDRDPNDSLASISGLITQPEILNESCQLKPYQLTGLNWLILMHEQNVNGILADEMGLGKTVQAIAFIAHLIEQGEDGPHLIIVPSSTVNNWVKEFKHWCPSVNYILYYGSQQDRLYMREEIMSEDAPYQVIITTYNMATGKDDMSLFRRLNAHYVVFDEGHMLKNMQSQRYQKLSRIRASRRLLLTGTPLQNNLLELMSLLSFVMPSMFGESAEGLKLLFANNKLGEEDSTYGKERAEQAKKIMKPFVLRRLKKDVLQQLPPKHEHIMHCKLSIKQQQLYEKLLVKCYQEYQESRKANQYKNILMALRMMCNHPLLLRNYYADTDLRDMARKYCRDIANRGCEEELVYEDMTVMSDFELHRLCLEQRNLSSHVLDQELLYDSGKFEQLDSMLPGMKRKDDRVLLFSQFTLVMDIIEVYLQKHGYRYLRLDGETPVVERQSMIDKFNADPDIFLFLLSTRAGGLGINLTSANVVILHDIDFNPYNDKQAEDRCHRLGQTRDVHVYKLIAQGTIEENMLKCANSKLKLEKDVVSGKDQESDASGRDAANVLTNVFKNLRNTLTNNGR